jgi:hypothetical protein
MATVAQIYSPIPVVATTTPPALLESSAAAIARFRPTPREIISRIAPHVLEEHGMKRRRAQSPRQSISHTACPNTGTKMPGSNTTIVMKTGSSPLRFSAVVSLDADRDHSRIYFGTVRKMKNLRHDAMAILTSVFSVLLPEQPDHHAAIVSDIMLFPVQSSPAPPPPIPAKDPVMVSRLLSGAMEKPGKTKTEKMKGKSYVQLFRWVSFSTFHHSCSVTDSICRNIAKFK